MENLGKWAVIDIETTGINAFDDSIIDVGFLQFEGTKLVRKYQSLVHYEGHLSQFIKKLTGINAKMLASAPTLNEVEVELSTLEGHVILAHNSDFEKSFLEYLLPEDADKGTQYIDSIALFALMFPGRSSYSLESFIREFRIRDQEKHRGFEDSLDLLKVMLVALKSLESKKEFSFLLETLLKKHALDRHWAFLWPQLAPELLDEIAGEIDFDREKQLQCYEESLSSEEYPIDEDGEPIEWSFNGESIKKIFRDEGKIQKNLPHYRYRKSQEDLAIRTGQAFKNNVHAYVQAPTGTGKTLGYLLPATLFSDSQKKQVLVATGTKNLQNQAMAKDIPQLKSILGKHSKSIRVARLVGSGNHLCELMFRQAVLEEGLLLNAHDFDQKFSNLMIELFFEYNSVLRPPSPLLKTDLPHVLRRKSKAIGEAYDKFGVDFRACTGSKCPYKGNCSYIKGLQEAREAHIIVGNHAMMFSWPKGFARPQYIVVDEAHKIENEATKAHAISLDQKQLEYLQKSLAQMSGIGALFYLLANREETIDQSSDLITDLKKASTECAEILKEHSECLPELCESYFKENTKYSELYWNEVKMFHKKSVINQQQAAIVNRLESIQFTLKSFYEKVVPYAAKWDENDFDDQNQIIAFTRFLSFLTQIEDALMTLEQVFKESTEKVAVLKFHAKHGPCLESAPIDIGKIIHDGLLQTSESVVFTSATLANSKGDLGVQGVEWMTGHSYLAPEKRFKTGLFLPSIYDYGDKAKVYLCDDTPKLYDYEFVPKALGPVIKLIEKIGGKSLLLFSAKTRFEQAREILIEVFENKIPLFIQGMGGDVVSDFKASQSGILLGMESMSEGIDIPGKALQFIFVDKIPDMRMDQITQARRDFYSKSFGNEFTDYFLSYRTRGLQQKLGRLLRSEHDSGGIIIVDSRIKMWKNKTVKTFNKLMEPYQVQRMPLGDACEEVGKYIFNSNTV